MVFSLRSKQFPQRRVRRRGLRKRTRYDTRKLHSFPRTASRVTPYVPESSWFLQLRL